MLFIFEQPKKASFWMRNTKIPLSIAYIDSAGKILEIKSMNPLDETVDPERLRTRWPMRWRSTKAGSLDTGFLLAQRSTVSHENRMKTKEQTIELLETIARLLELKGENPFKIRAYTNAARALETFSGNFQTTVTENKLGELNGIGDAITKKISEYVQTGRLEYFEKLQAEFPETIFELFEITGLGGKKVKALYEKFGVKNYCRSGSRGKRWAHRRAPGFGAKTATNLLQAIERRRKHSGRFLLSDAKIWSDELLDHFLGHPDVSQISCRRKLPEGKRNNWRPGHFDRDQATPTDHRAFSFPSGHRSGPRQRRDEGQRTFESWDPGRFAGGCKSRVSVCALLFHRKQGTQRGAPRTCSAKWLDLQ